MNSILKAEDLSSAQPARAPARRAGRPRRLTLDQILDAGLAIGLDHNLTMAAVAERLGVSATVLYGYVSGRDELIHFAAARAAMDHNFPNDEGQYWGLYAAQHAQALYDLMTGPGGLLTQYLTGKLGPESDLDRTEIWLAAFTQRGFSVSESFSLLEQMGLIVVGGAVMGLNDQALGNSGVGYTAAARRMCDSLSSENFPLTKSQAEGFVGRVDVWRRGLLELFEGVAAKKGEAFPKADVAALLGL